MEAVNYFHNTSIVIKCPPPQKKKNLAFCLEKSNINFAMMFFGK